MKKVNEFLKNWGMLIITPLIIIMFFRTCNTKIRVEKIENIINRQSSNIDTLNNLVIKLPKIIQENDDQQTAKFLYWERQADGPEYKTYTIKDYYEAIKK